jgi:hypothetical protein
MTSPCFNVHSCSQSSIPCVFMLPRELCSLAEVSGQEASPLLLMCLCMLCMAQATVFSDCLSEVSHWGVTSLTITRVQGLGVSFSGHYGLEF